MSKRILSERKVDDWMFPGFRNKALHGHFSESLFLIVRSMPNFAIKVIGIGLSKSCYRLTQISIEIWPLGEMTNYSLTNRKITILFMAQERSHTPPELHFFPLSSDL
jgi:hypothetical protein